MPRNADSEETMNELIWHLYIFGRILVCQDLPVACIGHEADGPFEKRINNIERFNFFSVLMTPNKGMKTHSFQSKCFDKSRLGRE